MHHRRLTLAATITAILAFVASARAADAPWTHATYSDGDFKLVDNKSAADITYDPTDAKVVGIVANLLAADVQRVTAAKPEVLSKLEPRPGHPTIVIGTLGTPGIDALIKDFRVDTSAIKGQWESYLITTVPAAQNAPTLLVIGADRRGTAYGALEISKQIGVSPWYWWADVATPHQDNLYIASGRRVHGPPSVKYRGIFINDEDWGMQPWAAKNFEIKDGGDIHDIGPKTYAKIFELLLRLNANFCWPAMHNVTQAFNIYPQNKQVADDYAIVMGSSHCEQLLRNGVTEWHDAQGRVGEAAAATYNWVTNKQGILDYWSTRLQENGKFENVYTLGLRGVHDSDMAGGGNAQQKAARLNEIYAAQTDLLKKYVNPDVASIPQIVCPYKEALIYYQNGAVPPEYVTLVWADDNHGYIRQLSTPDEQKRPGGAGVYYHVSYWGAPHDYLWLCTTPPALVWEEMSKAYDYNARTLWVLNVGDLKPAEIDINLFTSMAYDTSRYDVDHIGDYLQNFATQVFGSAHAKEIAEILNAYYHLNYQRKPEHMGFNTSQNPVAKIQPTPFTDEEILDRLAAFAAIRQKADAIYATLPPDQKDSYFELIAYPVRASALQNEKLLYADINRRAAAAGDAATAQSAVEKSKAAFDQIQTETAYYNDTLAGGKWKYMMSSNPHNQDVFKLPAFATAANGPATRPAATTTTSTDLSLPPHFPPIELAFGWVSYSYTETNGYFSFPAEYPTRKIDHDAAWKLIRGLGRLGSAVAAFPTTTPSIADPKGIASSSPELQYMLTVTSNPAAPAKVIVQAIPTHRINPQRGLRYAVAIDDEMPIVVDLETPENNPTWAGNVLRGAAIGTSSHKITAGRHTLHIYMVDPGVVLDHIIIDLGGLKPSYLPPRDTGVVVQAG